MHSNNLYSSYKRDTKDVLYWMINVTNSLVRTSENHPSSHPVQERNGDQVAVDHLISMSHFIVDKNERVPDFIFRYLKSVIYARKIVAATFQQPVGSIQDDAIIASNKSHRHFITTLERVYSIFGGQEWEVSQAGKVAPLDDAEDLEKLALMNRFKGLTVEKAGSSSSEGDQPASSSRSRQTKKKGKKQKKKKGGKKNNSKRQIPDHEVSRDKIQMIDQNESLLTDYSMAVLSAVKEWAELRPYMQNMWQKVAYKSGNSAVAAGTAKVAISIVKKTGTDIFIDFTDRDTYYRIVNCITRGSVDQAQGMFALDIDYGSDDPSTGPTLIDIREQFLINIYENLKDFIADFRLNRNGKPSNNMRSRLNTWRPDMDLQSLTEQERLDWRRLYVIKWLYDLVNAHYHKSVYGLKDFAREVTKIAMSNNEVSRLIYGHHVFQLQCIVDAFTISRGWTPHPVEGHVMRPAASATASRDLDTFFHGNPIKGIPGYTQSSTSLKITIRRDERYRRIQDIINALPSTRRDFLACLGEHDDMPFMEDKTLVRPTDENLNSLLQTSPFLCGAALLECLGLSYKIGMFLWEVTPDPTLILHLNGGALDLGFTDEENELWDRLETWLMAEFFPGYVQTQTAGKNLQLAIDDQVHNNRQRLNRPPLRCRGHYTNDILKLVDLKSNESFTTGSMVTCLQAAGWSVGDIPDEDLPLGSTEFWYRMDHTPRELDPETNKLQLADSVLRRRTKDSGMAKDNYIFNHIKSIKSKATKVRRGLGEDFPVDTPARRTSQQLELSTGATVGGPSSQRDIITYRFPQPRALPSVLDDIEAAHTDLEWDICGRLLNDVGSNQGAEQQGGEASDSEDEFTGYSTLPLSGMNYVDITCRMHKVLKAIEERLRVDEDPLYNELYTDDNIRDCRARLVMEVLHFFKRDKMSKEEDKRLASVADVLNKECHQHDIEGCLFWGEENQSTDDEDVGGHATECNVS
ncbi:hypothetical protein FHETE_10600 [Fusarium heterosporum]|uniref:DUF6604 domain-containing protein n=1 Tax=Fusarium heterosporum TaxID=42747 RepID=A0A8H5SU87_FUSHE|nr:hypothetical protein FHETE_10600 [Fusarium heterosporum]